MHSANQIIMSTENLLREIRGLTVVVHRKVIAKEKLPAVRLLFGKNKPIFVGVPYTDWLLTLHIDIVLMADIDDINEATTRQILAVHQKLMATNALQLSFVQNIEPLGQEETQFNTESEYTFAEVPNSFDITYRAITQDPSRSLTITQEC